MLEDLTRLQELTTLMRDNYNNGLDPAVYIEEVEQLADKIGRALDPKLSNWVQRAAIYGINPAFPSG